MRLDLSAVWAEHVTAEVGEQRWVSLPAEYLHDAGCIGCCPKPPAVLVEALGDCARCQGTGLVLDHPTLPPGVHDAGACRDCVDGRPLIEVTVPCWHVDCDGDISCWGCHGAGHILVGVWVADMPDGVTEPLQVIDGAVISHDGYPEDFLAVDEGGRMWRNCDWQVDLDPALPSPADRVGEHGIRLRRVR